jgi:hypothetical protein
MTKILAPILSIVAVAMYDDTRGSTDDGPRRSVMLET